MKVFVLAGILAVAVGCGVEGAAANDAGTSTQGSALRQSDVQLLVQERLGDTYHEVKALNGVPVWEAWLSPKVTYKFSNGTVGADGVYRSYLASAVNGLHIEPFLAGQEGGRRIYHLMARAMSTPQDNWEYVGEIHEIGGNIGHEWYREPFTNELFIQVAIW